MIQRSLVDRLTAEAHDDGVQQLVVGAVIASDSAVLLLRRPADDFMGGIYELASGKVAPGEILDEALVREVKEESGLDIEEITRYRQLRLHLGKRQEDPTVQLRRDRHLNRAGHPLGTRRVPLDPYHPRTPGHRRRQAGPRPVPRGSRSLGREGTARVWCSMSGPGV